MTQRLIGAAALLVCAAALSACGSSTGGVPVAADPTGATGIPRPTTVDPTSSGAPSDTESSCDYRRTPADEPAGGRDVGLPRGDEAPKKVTLVTDQGEIAMTMDAAAPCTTASIAHLATSGFYDDSPCHRITKSQSLSVLQCGDPTGQGTGGPGYTLPDENPKNLAPSGTADYVVYPRGTVAMANTGQPHSGGSQFFLVYADSVLPPTYAVFATVDDAGLGVLDKIASAGVSGGGQDGPPATAVTVKTAQLD
ncbi:peptidylprolyl isomerase [Actinokineospora guangxiensis]|uniref:Peptidylprolyl isomerase n=1 Tax=Actinokineospora guangxiensis TaxID=1490288 RepID=A0ABW0ER96_9PSEU